MTRLTTMTAAIVFAVLATGCPNSTTTPGYIGYTSLKDGAGERTVLFGFDANRRGQLARLSSSGELIDSCAEPPPDAATTLAQKASAEASAAVTTAAGATGSGKVAGSYEASQAVMELGKRSSETMFLREILFRRCEARMNARVVTKEQAASVKVGDLAKTSDFTAAELVSLKMVEEKQNKLDDAFFDTVIGAYSGLAATKERAEQLALVRELQQKLSGDDLKDSEVLRRLGEAARDPAKVPSVYERVAELAKQREKAKRDEAEKAAKLKCDEKQKVANKECKDDCKGNEAAVKACKKEGSSGGSVGVRS